MVLILIYNFNSLVNFINFFFQTSHKDGKFVWSSIQQSTILTAFFYGYVVTQIPFGILSKKYGAIYFLGFGMLINSIFGLFVPIAAEHSLFALIVVRFIQGLGEVSINNSNKTRLITFTYYCINNRAYFSTILSLLS